MAETDSDVDIEGVEEGFCDWEFEIEIEREGDRVLGLEGEGTEEGDSVKEDVGVRVSVDVGLLVDEPLEELVREEVAVTVGLGLLEGVTDPVGDLDSVEE